MHSVDVERSLQVVDFVLQNARSPAGHFSLEWFAFGIEPGDFHLEMPIDQGHVPLHRQTPFEKGHFVGIEDPQNRIEYHEQGKWRAPSFFTLLGGQSRHSLFGVFEDDHGQTHANLRRSEAHARSGTHGFHHGPDERSHFVRSDFGGIDGGRH